MIPWTRSVNGIIGHEGGSGRGLSPDILESSIRAYVNAINKAIAMEEKAMI